MGRKHKKRLTEDQVKKIVEMLQTSHWPHDVIAAKLRVTTHQVANINSGQCYRKITQELTTYYPIRYRHGYF